MPQSEHKSFNIVLMQIIGPLLIMAMVGSLVFFLIEVMYRGPHVARMYWVMFLFTGASVLVSRISIEEGRERAMLFGLALSAATLVTCGRLVEFSYSGVPMLGMLVSASLIAVILWCTSKLTWDCTVVDRSRDTSAVGLVDRFRQQVQPESDSDKNDKANGKDESQANDIFSRILKTITGSTKSNTPGLWVFYFAVFAFPVFGLGQWFVAPAAKSWVFVLFAAYLGSALCLLAMTSLMSLNRYLATRKLEVPDKIARNWMIIGASFAAFVVLLVMMLPRPASSGSFENMFAWFHSPDRNTSKFAVGKDGNKNDEDAKKQRVDENSDGPKVDGDKGKAEGDGKDGEKGSQKGEKSKDLRNDGEIDSNDKGDRKDSSNNKDGKQQSKVSKKSDSNNKSKKSNDNKQAQKRHEQQHKQAKDNSRKANDRKAGKQRKQANQQRLKNQRQNQNQQNNAKQQQQNSSFSKLMESVSKITKLLVYAVGVAALLFVFWMLRDDLVNLWALLMGKKKEKSESFEEISPAPKSERPPPSFASFKNPFRNGKAKSMFGWQLAQYTMAALEAWGREYGVEREIEKTPQEFAFQLKEADIKVSQYARQFADVYGRIAFSEDKVSREEFEPLVKLWDQMSIAMQSSRNRAAAVAPSR